VPTRTYTEMDTRRAVGPWIARAYACSSLGEARRELYRAATEAQYRASEGTAPDPRAHVIRDSARALRSMLTERADHLAGFSVAQALFDIGLDRHRDDLGPGFHAEMVHLWSGLQGRFTPRLFAPAPDPDSEGPEELATDLDSLWETAQTYMVRYEDGLSSEAVARRAARREAIQSVIGGTDADWLFWEWQTRHTLRRTDDVAAVVRLSRSERNGLLEAECHRMPFGVTPYYASLMDEEGNGRDRSIRAQVLPPAHVAQAWGNTVAEQGRMAMDFMEEGSTSPLPLVTRRYPAVAVLKPFRACPQVCVYCQRNWELAEVMSPDALAPWGQIEEACRWIESHPAIRELLITGGDPLALDDRDLERILRRVDSMSQLDVIRIGTRTPVTLPMRITNQVADLLGGLRRPGSRDVMVMTHIQHPYEVTPELVGAVNRLRARGMGIYNQLVYTFHVSRRFEATRLRMLLRRVGVDPYYTFVPKAKPELDEYRVPIARLLQEQKEEARLLPGTRRTDEAVYNIPRLGKSHLRAAQHRDLVSVLPNGSRVYEFHPWEKNIVPREPHIGVDVPILDYLQRLEAAGEDPEDYGTIWHYF
jgi:lysine 2,3-aminomutase